MYPRYCEQSGANPKLYAPRINYVDICLYDTVIPTFLYIVCAPVCVCVSVQDAFDTIFPAYSVEHIGRSTTGTTIWSPSVHHTHKGCIFSIVHIYHTYTSVVSSSSLHTYMHRLEKDLLPWIHLCWMKRGSPSDNSLCHM